VPFHVLWENGDTTLESQRLHEGWNTVSISDASNCPILDSVNISTSTMGISVIDVSKSILVFPNPAKDYVTIDLGLVDASASGIEMMSTDGKLLKSLSGTLRDKIQVETKGLSNGIYYFRIKLSDGTIANKKVIVIR